MRDHITWYTTTIWRLSSSYRGRKYDHLNKAQLQTRIRMMVFRGRGRGRGGQRQYKTRESQEDDPRLSGSGVEAGEDEGLRITVANTNVPSDKASAAYKSRSDDRRNFDRDRESFEEKRVRKFRSGYPSESSLQRMIDTDRPLHWH